MDHQDKDYFFQVILIFISRLIDRCVLYLRAKKKKNLFSFSIKILFISFSFSIQNSQLSTLTSLSLNSLNSLTTSFHRCQPTPTLPTHTTGYAADPHHRSTPPTHLALTWLLLLFFSFFPLLWAVVWWWLWLCG